MAMLFAGSAAAQQEAQLLGGWSDPELPGSNVYNNIYNEIWGLVVDGREYAVIGSTAGTHFIDVTHPDTMWQVAFVPGAVQGGQIIHRDYHHYRHYLYAVADEGNSTLQIIDFSGLPDTVEVIYDSPQLIRRSHNIFIDSTTALLYAFATNGVERGSYAMRIFDISQPAQPVYLAEYHQFGTVSAGQVHDGYVREGIAFLHCGGAGFAIVDFSNPSDPHTLRSLTTYPQRGYSHSGWLSDDATVYYMADENHAVDLKVLDVTDPCTAEVVTTFNAGTDNVQPITHNQIVACNYLYTSYYYDGLQVFDISDPEYPERVLYYDTYDGADGPGYKGAWGVYPFLPSGHILISDMQTGLYVFEGPGDHCAASQVLSPVNTDCSVISYENNDPLPEYASVFPNPSGSGSKVTWQHGNIEQSVRWQLRGIDGKVVLEGRTASGGETPFKLPDELPGGIYLLTTVYDDGEALPPVRLMVLPR